MIRCFFRCRRVAPILNEKYGEIERSVETVQFQERPFRFDRRSVRVPRDFGVASGVANFAVDGGGGALNCTECRGSGEPAGRRRRGRGASKKNEGEEKERRWTLGL